MPRRSDIAAEWARIGDRVAASGLPPRLVRRLLGALTHLARCESPVIASEAVTAFSEVLTGRPSQPSVAEQLEAIATAAHVLAHRERPRRRGSGRRS
jgi:hypothetical protein